MCGGNKDSLSVWNGKPLSVRNRELVCIGNWEPVSVGNREPVPTGNREPVSVENEVPVSAWKREPLPVGNTETVSVWNRACVYGEQRAVSVETESLYLCGTESLHNLAMFFQLLRPFQFFLGERGQVLMNMLLKDQKTMIWTQFLKIRSSFQNARKYI